MLTLARRRAPRARFRRAPFVDVRTPQCAAVLALGEAFIDRLAPRAPRRRLPAIFAPSTTR